MYLFKNEDKYYLSKNNNKYYGWNGNIYIIKNGKLVWANSNIYLQSSGTQYINTGITADSNTSVILNYQIDNVRTISSNTRNHICGGSAGYTKMENFYAIFWCSTETNTYYWLNTSNLGSGTNIGQFVDYTAKYRIELNGTNINTKSYLYKNNVLLHTRNNATGEITQTLPLSIFARTALNTNYNTFFIGKIYNSIINKNNIKIQHLVPVPKGLLIGNFVVPSNGMFDIVEQKFYGNQGTGDFTIGGIPEDYIIDNGKLIWCRDDIYLESTGTQYINTNLKGYLNFNITTQGTLDNTVSQVIISRHSAQGNWFGQYSSTKMWSIGTDTSSVSYLQKGTFDVSFQDKKVTYTYNNTTYEKESTTDYSDNNIYLFCCNSNNKYYATAKLWKSIAYQNDSLIQYLVPVPKGMLIGDKISPSNCMFDIITQTFFENQGTGEFVYAGLNKDLINVGNNIVWTDENVYLQSSGSKYIDTGIKPTNLTEIEGKVLLSEINKFIYGSRTSKTDIDLHDWVVNTATANFPQFGSDEGSVTFSWSLNQTYIINNSQNGGYVNGTKIKSYSNYTFKSTLNMYLFGLNQNGSLESRSLKGKIYYFEIFENLKLIRYFLPVNTNTVIGDFTVPAPGMWDAVTKTFYPNKGTGSFTYGKDN